MTADRNSAAVEPLPVLEAISRPTARWKWASATSSDAVKKRAGLEVLRLLACLGIIWFHVGTEGRSIGYAGLPALMALSVALAASRSGTESLNELARKRAKRLLLPWAFWSGVFALLKIADALRGNHPISDEFQGWMLFTGPAIHLWYLPFAFLATWLAAISPSRFNSPGFLRTAIVWGGCGVALLLFMSWAVGSLAFKPPWAQWAFVLPAVCLGMALSAAVSDGASAGAWMIAIAVVIACSIAWLMGWRMLALPYAAGIVALTLASAVRAPAGPLTIWFGSLAFGIYIVHPLLAIMIRRLGAIPDGAILALTVIVASLATTAALRRTPLRVLL